MTNRLLLLTTLLSLVATGCASAPSFEQQQQGLAPPQSGNGRLYVYRLDGDGTTIRPSVKIDGESVGRAVPGTFFYRDMPVGNYEVSSSSDKDSPVSFRLRSGEVKYVRFDADLTPTSWDIIPVLVDSEVAGVELTYTKYAGN